MPLHAYRLVYPDSLHGSELRWEWEKEHITRLFWNAATFERELARQYCLTWNSLAEDNQRIWETYYAPRPAYEPWKS